MMPSKVARRLIKLLARPHGGEQTSLDSLEAEVLVLSGGVAAQVGDTDCLVSDD